MAGGIERIPLTKNELQLSNKINLLLEKDNRENRQRLRQIFHHPTFIPRFDVSLSMQRELALERLRQVTDHHGISVLDFERNPLNIFAGTPCFF